MDQRIKIIEKLLSFKKILKTSKIHTEQKNSVPIDLRLSIGRHFH